MHIRTSPFSSKTGTMGEIHLDDGPATSLNHIISNCTFFDYVKLPHWNVDYNVSKSKLEKWHRYAVNRVETNQLSRHWRLWLHLFCLFVPLYVVFSDSCPFLSGPLSLDNLDLCPLFNWTFVPFLFELSSSVYLDLRTSFIWILYFVYMTLSLSIT